MMEFNIRLRIQANDFIADLLAKKKNASDFASHIHWVAVSWTALRCTLINKAKLHSENDHRLAFRLDPKGTCKAQHQRRNHQIIM
jgi:hypothetical protein